MLVNSNGSNPRQASCQAQSCVSRVAESLTCFLQVIANPFIWSRMKHPDRPVPFLFEEFSPTEQQQNALALQPSLQPADAAAPLSPAELLESVIAIAQQLIGAKVRHINQEDWTLTAGTNSNLSFSSASLSA